MIFLSDNPSADFRYKCSRTFFGISNLFRASARRCLRDKQERLFQPGRSPRKPFPGFDIILRHKMSAMMHQPQMVLRPGHRLLPPWRGFHQRANPGKPFNGSCLADGHDCNYLFLPGYALFYSDFFFETNGRSFRPRQSAPVILAAIFSRFSRASLLPRSAARWNHR